MKDKIKKYVIPNLPYALIFYFCCKIGEAYRITEGADFAKKFMGLIETLGKVMQKPGISINLQDILIGIIGAALIYAVVYTKKKNAKKWRKNMEYGSARGVYNFNCKQNFIDGRRYTT
jgi:type IV secretion system protein VirD4